MPPRISATPPAVTAQPSGPPQGAPEQKPEATATPTPTGVTSEGGEGASNIAPPPPAPTPPPPPPPAPDVPPARSGPPQGARKEPTDIERIEFALTKVLVAGMGPRVDQARNILTDVLGDLKREASAKADREKEQEARAKERGFKTVEEMREADIAESARLEKEAEELGFGSALIMQRAGPEAVAAARAKKRGYRSVAEMEAADKRSAEVART